MRTKADMAHDEAEAAVVFLDELDRQINALPVNATAKRAALEAQWSRASADTRRKLNESDRLGSIEEHRKWARAAEAGGNHAVARGSLRRESAYHPDGSASFFADLIQHRSNPDAFDRLQRHQREMRDVVAASGGAAEFVVPQYLQSAWIATARGGRPFVDALPTMPLPASGLSFVLPRVATAPTVAVQAAENDAVQETDLDSESVTVFVRTFSGQNDVSLQTLERSDPSIDQVIFNELTSDYDEKLDASCLSGAGTLGTHKGIRAVTGINAQTYTASTPVATGLLAKVYAAIADIATNRKRTPTHVVMHPRRAAWLASALSSTVPLMQQGQLMQAIGVQDGGFLRSYAGLAVILDPQVGVTYGAGTNEDEIYIVYAPDLMFGEGPLNARILQEPLSGTLQARLQVYAYSALASERYPKAIAKVSGTGLAAPTF